MKRKVLYGAVTLLLCFCLCGCHFGAVNRSAYSSFSAADIAAFSEPEQSSFIESNTAVASSRAQKSVSEKSTVSQFVLKDNETAVNDSVSSSEEVSIFSSQNLYTPVRFTNYHGYNSIPKSLQPAYQAIKNAASTRTVGFVSLGNIPTKQVQMLYQAVKNDYPEYFWLPNEYVVRQTDRQVQMAFEYEPANPGGEVLAHYLCTAEERINCAAQLRQAVNQVTAELNRYAKGKRLEAFEIEKFVYDYVCSHTNYDESAAASAAVNPFAFTAYGALVQGQAVCEGYARAVQLLLNMYGVENMLVSGQSKSNSVGHLWNEVKIDGAWYHLDATYGDFSDNIISYTYFNLNDAALRDRVIDNDYVTDYSHTQRCFNLNRPKCVSTDKNYLRLNGELIMSGSPVQTQIKQLISKTLKNGKQFCEIAFDSTFSKNEITQIFNKTDFNGLVHVAAYEQNMQNVFLKQLYTVMCDTVLLLELSVQI